MTIGVNWTEKKIAILREKWPSQRHRIASLKCTKKEIEREARILNLPGARKTTSRVCLYCSRRKTLLENFSLTLRGRYKRICKDCADRGSYRKESFVKGSYRNSLEENRNITLKQPKSPPMLLKPIDNTNELKSLVVKRHGHDYVI